MNIFRKYPYECLFYVALIFFVLIKLGDLVLPFHWDELGAYAPGAFYMVDTKHIGLLPSCLPGNLSWGHPLFFTFCNAVVFNLFGENHIVGHSFAMIITIITLIVFFLFAQQVFNEKTAFFSSILLMAHPNFYTCSVMTLPEMMLSLFTIISIWGIVSKKWWLYASGASLAMMTKESAIVIPVLAGLVILVDAIRIRDYFSWSRFRMFLLGILPLLVFGLFLVIQKIQNGWFFFPLQISHLNISWAAAFPIGKRILWEMFFSHGKWLTGGTFLAGLLLCFLGKPLRLALNVRILWIFAGLCLFISLFSSVNVYLPRYILYSAPFIVLGGVHTFFTVADRIFTRLKVVGVISLACLSVFISWHTQNSMLEYPYGDMSYKFPIKVVKDAVSWLELQPWKYDTIETNFPFTGALADRRLGYLTGDDKIPFRANFEKKTRYGLLYFEWSKGNIPNLWKYKYNILKMWSERYSNVVWVEYLEDTTASAGQ